MSMPYTYLLLYYWTVLIPQINPQTRTLNLKLGYLITGLDNDVKLITCQCFPHIESSQLICTAKQLTGFYIRATVALNGLN